MPFENPLDRKQTPAQKKTPPLATKGRQDTGNVSLAQIDEKLKKLPTDNEVISLYYKANKNGNGYLATEFILRTDIVNTIYKPAKTLYTLWFNQNSGLLISEPPQVDLDVVSSNVVTVTNPFNLEATQLLIKTLLTNIYARQADGTQLTQITNLPAVVDENLVKVNGTTQTARDWSLDFLKLQNVDIALSALRDALRGVSSRTNTDIYDKLVEILAEQRDDILIEHELWYDGSVNPDVYYRVEIIRSQDTGAITSTVITRLSDNVVVVSLPAGSLPVAGDVNKKIEFYRYVAINNGTGYSTNDFLSNTLVFDTISGTVLLNLWYNLTTSTAIAAPLGADIKEPLPNNAAQETGGNLAFIKAKTDNLDIALSALRDAIRGVSNKTLSDITTALIDGTQQTNIYGAITKVSVTATASGDTTIVTPAAGKKIRLFKFSYSADGNNLLGTVASLKFGANPAIDKQWLDPKQPYADGLTMRFYDGGVNEALKINLSVLVSTGIYINIAYQEV